ncbi:putative aspartokinase [Zancudomyces culisetae]|uniref:Aspartokinase n=1 Tax=Zancudomyces culisetae TaxID=1213189 RepID=A0A1R1PNL3_ZANCU|nr:putative aspartokinase [Zancudomyces culisetae]|eukprot:OMH82548.1 putative aspartokinase [Zancudomyces culisetae]
MVEFRNASNKDFLVVKFGGTSVGKFADKICREIIPSLLAENRVIVVCSAISTNVKAKGTTSLLLQAAESVLGGKLDCTVHQKITQEIREIHLEAGETYIKSKDILEDYKQAVISVCARLEKVLTAAQVIDEVTHRTKDIIIGTGEQLSCIFVSALLKDAKVYSQLVDLERVIQKKFDKNKLDQEFYDYLSEEFKKRIEACGDAVPVVTGYFGRVPGSILKSIGRGYTDLTAALVAAGIRAKELQIWKEVDGIFTADPRKVEGARLLKIITPEEAAELTYYGSEVIHPFTMEQVVRALIPIRIKNVQNPAGEGTVVLPELLSSRTNSSASLAVRMDALNSERSSPKILLENGYHLDLTRRHPTAVTVKNDIIILNIRSNRKAVSYDFFEQIFSTLNKFSVVVDLIATSEVHVSMAISSSAVQGKTLSMITDELGNYGEVDVIKDMAILSLVGKQMRNTVGISGKMFTTLAKAGVNIEMISQGASEINISCVISNKNATTAMCAIHESLLRNTGTSLIDDPDVIKEFGYFNSRLQISDSD